MIWPFLHARLRVVLQQTVVRGDIQIMAILSQRLLLACLVVALWPLGSMLASAQAQTDSKPPAVASRVADVDPSNYRVGPEDVLEISVWHEDALKKEALVLPDGGISTADR